MERRKLKRIHESFIKERDLFLPRTDRNRDEEMKRESEYEAKTNTNVRLRYTELEKHGGTIAGGGQKSKKRQELSQGLPFLAKESG
ncbi:predicted protein [Arabidopsis lyrata subsp. lyrata]|uniref:Predicted protein n=1 Tax=Arabidopsis lyrata subsp. lyrata TaxID=81972 RepID=D7MVE9_ARALL|nr:predicted protein [Arabidopsis lyrata subsp. lyrata]